MKGNRIFLIGYIGSGKSAVGKAFSEITGFKAIDMDETIEQVESSSIKKMCIKYGEHEFRNKEAELLDKLCRISGVADVLAGEKSSSSKFIDKKSKYEQFSPSDNESIIVACGAGIVLDDVNCKILKSQQTIYLEGDPLIFFDRVKCRTDLPYAFMEINNEKERLEYFLNHYNKRKDLYKEASNYTVNIDGKSPEQIAQDILALNKFTLAE